MNFKNIIKLTAKDMKAVNNKIIKQLHSKVNLVNQISNYIINSGGKQIRPILIILIAYALKYNNMKHHVTIAAIIEFIHNATLLHDDVIDKSILRRGRTTTNVVFGNAASILIGDFIYTRSFKMMTTINSLKILKLISYAVNNIVEGEIMQLINKKNPNLSMERYMRIIYRKTACLFEVSSQISAILAGASKCQEKSLRYYGRYLGIIFQIMDDLIDYIPNKKIIEEKIGNDLRNGRLTLPLLHVMCYGNSYHTKLIKQIIKKNNSKLIIKVVNAINQCNSINYIKNLVLVKAKKAISYLDCLTPSYNKQALKNLIHIVIKQDY
ncbi:MAG: polyprenyl synthetase family protein [Candidatus Lightella neohaematopini]|nr:polyprenyl synthetase family protein [Candidatus Lightella neohaematopini]